MALRWAVRSVSKAGTIAIIGVYPPEHDSFPIGEAMQKNLTIKMGNCNHRRYIPELIDGALREGRPLARPYPARGRDLGRGGLRGPSTSAGRGR